VQEPAGHVFISYVHEDSDHVDALQQALQDAGVRVWRDKDDLWPGDDWRMMISRAITDNALVFIACFSSLSAARTTSYQNEELTLAMEQFRLRPPDARWLIPVRFDDCQLPRLNLGAGRTLDWIQRADLFGDRREAALKRLVTAVQGLLTQPSPGQDTAAETAGPVPHLTSETPAAQAAPPVPATTDQWRNTNHGFEVPRLMRIRDQSLSHPGYPYEYPPPSLRTATLIASASLGPTPTSSGIRARFLVFLGRPPVSSLLAAATTVPNDFKWTPWGDNPRRVFGAVLNGNDPQAAPLAWARLLLREDGASHTMHDPQFAEFVLHVFPRTASGDPTPAANLAAWYDRLTRALTLPEAFANFLAHDLDLATTGEPPAQIGISLDTPHSMTELVDTEDIPVLAGTSAAPWFLAWAIADPEGQTAPGVTHTWLTQMCDSALHLDGYELFLDALTNPPQRSAGTAPTAGPVAPVLPPPGEAESAVQRLKRALPDPTRRVELADLVNSEVQQLATQISDTTRHPLIGVPFADQLTAYEKETATAASLLATGVFHDDQAHTSLWIRSLKRLMSARRPITEDHHPVIEAMRHYPALLCLWAMGLSAVLADHENLLARFLLEPTWTRIFGPPAPQPAVHCLNPNRIVTADHRAPDGRRWLYPQSHYLRAVSRATFDQIEPDDDSYKEACDRLEYLASLIAMDTDKRNGLPWAGEFITRHLYIVQNPNVQGLLEGGAFRRDPERARAADEALTTWIAQNPLW
jgi:hypothetical protein